MISGSVEMRNDARLKEVIAQLRREEDEVHLVVPPTHTHTYRRVFNNWFKKKRLTIDKQEDKVPASVRGGAAI